MMPLPLALADSACLQRERAHLLRQADGVAAHDGTEGPAAAAELRHARRAVTGAAGALLGIHLLAGAADFAAVLGLVGAALALGELPVDAALEDVGARLEPEDRVRQAHRAGLLAVERGDLQFHVMRPPAWWRSRPAPLPPARRRILRPASPRIRRLELAGLRRFLRQRLLHRVAHRDPAALGAGHRALDQDQAALDVGRDDTEVERGDAVDAQMAGHLLVLEDLAGVLAAAGAADRAVRNRHAVRGAQAGEIPALHAAGKALADRGAGDIDELAGDEMVGGDLGADRDHGVVADAELRELALRLDLGLGEMAALGLAHVAGAARAGAELQRHIAVLVLGAVADDLALRQAQHRDRHMLTGLGEDPGHADLLCDHSGAHRFLTSILRA